MSIDSVMLSDHLVLCCLLVLLASVIPCVRDFSPESANRIKFLEFQHHFSNELSVLISFMIDWFNILAVQESSPAPQFDYQIGFRKGRGTRDQIANIRWIIKKPEFQINIYFFFIDYAKAFDCVDHNKLWKILKEMEIPDHLTCLLRNLYAGSSS